MEHPSAANAKMKLEAGDTHCDSSVERSGDILPREQTVHTDLPLAELKELVGQDEQTACPVLPL